MPRDEDEGVSDRPLSRPPRPPRDEDDDDRPRKKRRDDDDDDDRDDRPRKKRRDDDDDEDDRDDRPRKKRRDDDDEEDDRDDRPRKKRRDDDDEEDDRDSKKKKNKKDMPGLLLAAAIVAMVWGGLNVLGNCLTSLKSFADWNNLRQVDRMFPGLGKLAADLGGVSQGFFITLGIVYFLVVIAAVILALGGVFLLMRKNIGKMLTMAGVIAMIVLSVLGFFAGLIVSRFGTFGGVFLGLPVLCFFTLLVGGFLFFVLFNKDATRVLRELRRTMRFLDLTLPCLAENLALDEALLLDGESGGTEALRLWRWPHRAVVLGAGSRLADDVDETACRADDVPIVRRSTGGGTVLLGDGCLLFSLILAFDRDPALADLHASYRFILGRIQRALTPRTGPIDLQGSSDLTLDGRKFSGNAQQRKRTHLLHHGTILHGFDFAPVARYLKLPPRRPEYRQDRSHAEFLTNLPIAAATLESTLRGAWDADEPPALWPAERVRALVDEKYATAEWIRRR